MKIKISGKSGYLGTLISEELAELNHEVSGIGRNDLYSPVKDLAENITDTDVIINLTGAPIFQRWTKKNKQTIYDSRVKTTQNIISAINSLPSNKQPKKFISASAIGIYKSGVLHDEESKIFDDGFVGNVVKNWEKPLQQLPEHIQQNIFRIGLVLGEKAETINRMRLPFKLGLGAMIGNGEQPFPFIHEKDVVRAFVWAIEEFNHSDLFNLTAPQRINNKTFTKEFAKQFHRPALLFVPEIALKLLYGKASVLLVNSPSVASEKILNAGFNFHYPDISSALENVLCNK